MNIIIADDEPLALEMTCEAVREVCPKANIYPFSKPSRLLEFAKETRSEKRRKIFAIHCRLKMNQD